MDKARIKPAVVPTVYSLRTILGSIVLLALFGAFVCLYNAYGSLLSARSRLGESVPTRIETSLYSVMLPDGWAEYSVNGDSLTVFKTKGKTIPALHISAQSDPGFSYRALDENPMAILRRLDASVKAESLDGIAPDSVFEAVGSERLTVKPGVTAVRFLFDTGEFDGEGCVFYAGNVRYFMWAIYDDDDAETTADVRAFFRSLFERFDMPPMREHIDRPVVNSAEFTADINAETHLKIGRELALWRLFAARAEAEPDAALLPALKHYREVLTLLSSIREERTALDSEDFALYQTLLQKRRKDVAEWFVVLDKAVSMRDWKKARSFANWIMRHATLTGERLDARRAADILATKVPAESAD